MNYAPSRHIKILFLTENYFPSRGGMAQSADRIVNSLRNKNIEVDVLHFSSKRQFKDKDEKNGWYKCRQVGLDQAHSLNLIWNEIESLDQDWTHVAAFGGYIPLLAGPVFSSWLNADFTVHLRGNDFDTGVFTPRKREVLMSALKEAATVCCVSTDKVERVKKMFPGKNAVWTPNGIDLNLWQPLKSDFVKAEKIKEEFSGKKVIGFFGHLKEKKGLLFFIDCLRKSGYVEQAHLLLVGEMDEESASQLSESNDLCFTHISFLDRYELIPYYMACDFTALPSFYDGMPNVILESGALGGVFIASNAGGIGDILKDQEHGFIFSKGNQYSCIQAIKKAMQCSNDKYERFSEYNKQFFTKSFTAEKEIQNHIKALTQREEINND